MTYTYTDQQLSELNRGKNVYSVNLEYAKRKENRTAIVTEKPNHKLKKGEVNTFTTLGGQRFRVIATKSDPKTGFDGMAVAPIVNGRVDYKNVVVVAAGADPNSKTNSVGPLSRDIVNALYPLSPQYEVADQFVKEIKDNPKYEVTQLTGYSQGSNSQMKI